MPACGWYDRWCPRLRECEWLRECGWWRAASPVCGPQDGLLSHGLSLYALDVSLCGGAGPGALSRLRFPGSAGVRGDVREVVRDGSGRQPRSQLRAPNATSVPAPLPSRQRNPRRKLRGVSPQSVAAIPSSPFWPLSDILPGFESKR